MITHWLDLTFWNSGELQVILERLSGLESKGISYCPSPTNGKRDKLFRVFDEVPFDKVKVVFLGQDPYPSKVHATGIAFEVPQNCTIIPPSLAHLYRELTDDLHDSYPVQTRLLTPWLKQGVLLLNTYYTCLEGQPGSHQWSEYEELTKQVLEALKDRKVVFVLMGGKAHKFAEHIPWCAPIKVSHPSPLGVTKENPLKGISAFKGSRIFTKVNEQLVNMKQEPINWRLP